MRQAANAKHQKFINLKGIPELISHHRIITIVSIIASVLLAAYIWTSFVSYSQKFSKVDFERLTTMATVVLKHVSNSRTYGHRTCSYERPTEFGALFLFCRIQLVTYVAYQNPHNALAVARDFDSEIQRVFGTEKYFGFSSFYSNPKESSDTATVTLVNRSPSDQCNFYIESNSKAERAVSFATEQVGTGSIALSFECSAESQGEYFPVTYRQD